MFSAGSTGADMVGAECRQIVIGKYRSESAAPSRPLKALPRPALSLSLSLSCDSVRCHLADRSFPLANTYQLAVVVVAVVVDTSRALIAGRLFADRPVCACLDSIEFAKPCEIDRLP